MGLAHCGHACRAASACCQQGQHARCSQGAAQAAAMGDLWHTMQAPAPAVLPVASAAAPVLTPVPEALPPAARALSTMPGALPAAAPALMLAPAAALPPNVPALSPAPGALTPAAGAACPAGGLPAPALCDSTICLQDQTAAEQLAWQAVQHLRRALASVLCNLPCW